MIFALDLGAYLNASHVLVSASTGERSNADDVVVLRAIVGKSRRPFQVFLTAAWIAAQTDLIATLPAMVANRAAERGGAAVREPPIEMPESIVYMWWHPRFQVNPAHIW